MKSSTLYKFILLTLFYSYFSNAKAQNCGFCSVTITGSDTLSYTINIGQTLCIDSLAEFSGTIALNGGSICNRGSFIPKSFNLSTGIINNYEITFFKNNLALNNALSIINGPNATLVIDGDLSINGGTLTNSGVTNVKNTLTIGDGVLDNTAIINCHALGGTGVTAITNSGIINKDSN